jgi:hypothetical protein
MTELSALQRQMESTYGSRDRARGIPATVAWLAEEVGELAKAVRKGSRDEQLHELGDVLAWSRLAGEPARSLDGRGGQSLRIGLPALRCRALRMRRLI